MVCTAGITKTSEWIRLYPVSYRYLSNDQKYHKYQWIDVEFETRGKGNDQRKESRKPISDTINIIGKPISTKNDWAERRAIIDKLPHFTLNQYKEQYEVDKTSLGIVRPTRILDMKIEETNREWKPEWEAILRQMTMFGDQPKELAKIPYKFSYIFECEDSKIPHTAMCEDWELGVLYLNEVKRLGSEEKAAKSVRHKFLDDLCSPKNDTRFFMGTVFPYNTWVVLGVFYPPKIEQSDKPVQLSLF